MVGALQPWEWVAVAAAVAGGLLERLTRGSRARWLARLRASPRLASLIARPATAFTTGVTRFGPDTALLALVFVTTLPALRALWMELGAYGSPMGPDADENYLAAIALERDLPALYARDRYPAFAALVSLVASGPLDVHSAAVRVSIACALVGAVVAYVLGRQLGGRAAAVVGSALYLRLPGIVDVSRQFTPYMLVALLDLVAVALVVGAVRGRRVGVPLAGVLAVLWAADPKQMPVVLAFGGVGIALSFAQRSWVGLAGGIALAAAIPAANYAASSLQVRIFSVEEIAGRVDLGLTAPPVPTGSGATGSGYRLGGDLRALPATLERLAATEPRVVRGWLHDRVATSLPMELPRTSLLWLGIAGIGCFSLRCGWRRALATPLAILPLAPLAVATLHLHFQHRYFASLAAPAPALIASGVALVGGPGGVVGAGLVALYWPTSPWSVVAPGLLDPTPYNGEPWAGREPPDWTDALARAVQTLPAGASVADYSQSQPWTMLAAAFDYHRCTHTRDSCRSVVTAPGAPLAAILIAGEGVSVSAPGARALAGQSTEPDTIGACWTLAFDRPGPGAAYVWTCPERPGL